jgi:capsular exopolysaccharide synthesis family protein
MANGKYSHPSLLTFTDRQLYHETESGNQSQAFAALKRRWLLVALTALIVASASVGWRRINRSVSYQGQFQILIEPVTAESEVVAAVRGDQPSAEIQELGDTQASKTVIDYPTQIQVLRSRKLLDPVINELQSKFPQLSYGRILRNLQIGRLSSGKGNQAQGTKILQVLYESSSASEVQQFLDTLSKNYLDYSVNERQTNLGRALDFVSEQLPKVNSNVQQLERVLQEFRERHSLIQPGDLSGQVTGQIGTLQQQELDLLVEMKQAQELFRALQAQQQLPPKAAEAGSVLSEAPQYQAVAQRLQEIESQIVAGLAHVNENHPNIIQLRAEEESLKALLGQRLQKVLGERLASEVPNAQDLPFQNSLRSGLSQRLVDTSIQLQVLEARRQAILNSKNELIQRFQALPSLTREYEALQRRLQSSKDTLNQFLKVQEELKINAARQEAPWELIEPPSVALIENDDDLLTEVVQGLFLGLCLGAGLAILLDKSRDIIYTVDELKAKTKLPVLGMIPVQEEESYDMLAFLPDEDPASEESSQAALRSSEAIQNNGTKPQQDYQVSSFLEAFRSLYTQVRLLNPDYPIRSLVVSSCMPNEGKTMTATYLAQAAAAMGQRVLLVDADLRVPSIDQLLRLKLKPGLSDIIAHGRDADDVIQPLSSTPNLFVLTAGSLPPDPAILIGSKKMKDLADSWHQSYDLVVYDLPPISFADSRLLSSHTDGLVIVSRIGHTRREDLHNSLHTLRQGRMPILGIVANGVRTTHKKKALNKQKGQQVEKASG